MMQNSQRATSAAQRNSTANLFSTATFALLTLLLMSGTMSPFAEAKKAPKQAAVSFKREETIILNLEKAPKSAKHIILTSLRSAKETEKQLDKAIRQVEQADANFAKARNQRDSRTMNTTVERLKAAMQTTQQLEEQLDAANKELRADVQQTLISPH
jgi:hypothetical protein